MKTIQKRWLPLFLLATVTFLFPACEGNNPSIDGGDDTSGLITVKMRNKDYGDTSIPLNSRTIRIDDANNFYGMRSDGYETDYVKFCDMGTKKLSAIKTVPTSGWARKVAVTPNHSYVVRNEYSEWNSDLQRNEQKVAYLKLYVVDYITSTSGGIIGAEVQYCEWNPEQ
jgi:hypothetical protein